MREGWITRNFPDVVFIQEGPGIRKYEYENGGYPMINVRCVKDGYIDMSTARSANKQFAHGKWKHFQVTTGDILFTISGTIGRSAIVKKSDLPLLMNTSVVRFRPTTHELDRRFLYYFVNSNEFIAELDGYSTGAAQKNVGPTHIKRTKISYPPLPEQRRIVAILDEAFQGIDRAVANTEKNLANAREVFESYLNAVFFANDGQASKLNNAIVAQDDVVREGWRKLQVRKVLKLEYGKPLPKEDRSANGEFPAYGANGIKCRTDRIYFDRPSIIVGRKGSAGEVTLADGPFWPLDVTYFVTYDDRQHDLKFLYHLLKSLELPKLADGVKPGINRNRVYNLEAAFPPLPEQKRIVAILDELKANSTGLVCAARRKLDLLAGLKQSILQKAFAGEPTAGEPEPVLAKAGA